MKEQEEIAQNQMDQRNNELDAELLQNKDIKDISSIHQALMRTKLHSPSLNFTSKVMESIESIDLKKSFNWKPLFLLFGVLICIIISAYSLSSVSGGILQLPTNVEVLNQELPLNQLEPLFDYKLIVNGALFITLIVGMFFFDAMVLRPYFQQRKMA